MFPAHMLLKVKSSPVSNDGLDGLSLPSTLEITIPLGSVNSAPHVQLFIFERRQNVL